MSTFIVKWLFELPFHLFSSSIVTINLMRSLNLWKERKREKRKRYVDRSCQMRICRRKKEFQLQRFLLHLLVHVHRFDRYLALVHDFLVERNFHLRRFGKRCWQTLCKCLWNRKNVIANGPSMETFSVKYIMARCWISGVCVAIVCNVSP